MATFVLLATAAPAGIIGFGESAHPTILTGRNLPKPRGTVTLMFDLDKRG